MSWFSTAISSSLGRKLIMALTGLFLCSFLVVHLIGNLQLLAGDASVRFNEYAKFMTTFPLVKFLSYGLYAGFLIHIIDGVMLVMKNREARPVAYKVMKGEANSTWASRNMGLLGTIIFVFLVIHLKSFWYEMHFGAIGVDTYGNKDLYTVVDAAFSQLWYVILYVVAQIALAYHLLHGFQSAFQTFGLNHAKYTPTIKTIGFVFSILVPAGYAAIPLVMFFTK
jgi:succinate dehydrogenase / fumarate reductase cytochrome b subunit